MWEALRNLLEDFDVVGGGLGIALLRRRPVRCISLRENIHAAIIASRMGLKSIEHVKREYLQTNPETEIEQPSKKAEDLYVEGYMAAKQYIRRIIAKLQPAGSPPPPAGVFCASVVLGRLPDSFFSAHLLYRLACRYEGHAVARLILEQIAWAFDAYAMKNINDVKRIVTTKAISKLKKQFPYAGKLYGFLSEKTHVDYDDHLDFLKIENERNVILRTQRNYREYSSIILGLADLFGIVYELSQFDYIPVPETVTRDHNDFSVNPNRPFVREMKSFLLEFDEIPGDWGSGPDLGGYW